MPPLLADFTHARPCKPFCEKYLTLPAARPYGSTHFRRGRCPHRPAGTGSGPFWGYFACGRVTFCADRKSPKNCLGEGGFRFPPSPRYPIPLKRPIRGASAPLLETPPGAVLPRRCAPRQARRTARRPQDGAGRYPCSARGGRNGRGCSSHKAERRKTPSAFCLRPVPWPP